MENVSKYDGFMLKIILSEFILIHFHGLFSSKFHRSHINKHSTSTSHGFKIRLLSISSFTIVILLDDNTLDILEGNILGNDKITDFNAKRIEIVSAEFLILFGDLASIFILSTFNSRFLSKNI